MLKRLDNFLDRITMYRLILYFLTGLLIVAFILSALGKLTFSPLALILSVTLMVVVCWIVNTLAARFFRSHTNVESVYITALILALIISPPAVGAFGAYLPLALWASVLAMASKYVLAIKKKHIFNPAALAVVLTALVLGLPASWWVGTALMMPFVLIGGLLIVRKIRRADLVWSFFIAAAVSILAADLLRGLSVSDIPNIAERVILDTPLFFFAFVMLTEPLTTPPTRALRISYGALVGLLFAPSIHIGNIYSTPELALVIGNIFSYIVSPKQKLMLTLKEKVKQTPDVYDFVFGADEVLPFQSGQYLEWTLAHQKPDNRGNRRYFTVASSPTETEEKKEIRMGVKFYPEASSFKRQLSDMKIGDQIVASQLAGDFVLPKDQSRKLVLLAGGIGVTPFRSMIKYLTDIKEQRDIVLIYSARTAADIAYRDIFDQAQRQLGIKVIYVVGDGVGDGGVEAVKSERTARWIRAALLDVETVMREVPDYKDRIFYISGPHTMVTAFQETLKTIGVKNDHIKTDFFPGFA